MIPRINAPTVTTAECKRSVLYSFAIAFWLSLVVPLAAETLSNQDCLDCHTDPTTTRRVHGEIVPMALFPTNSFLKSVHAKLNCTDCHDGIKEMVHPSGLPPAQCASCHKEEAKNTPAAFMA